MAGFLARLTGGLLRDRTLTSTADISITNPAGDAGNPLFSMAGILAAISALTGTGFITRTGAGAVATRTITPGPNIAVSNGDGFAADPIISLTQGTALSVLGVTGNALAPRADIVAGSDGNVLRRSGTSVDFGAIALGSANAVSGTLADTHLSANVALDNIDNHLVAQTFATGSVVTTAANPLLYFNETGNAANQHFWRIGEESSSFYLQPLDDGLALQASFILDRLANINAFGGQINFPATQSASAGANTLDDYEEGSWTPVLGGSGGTSGQTYSSQLGTYVKIGKLVTVSFYIVLTNKGTITTTVQISGLPFANQANVFGSAYIGNWLSLGTNWVFLAGYIAPSTSIIVIDGIQAAAATLTTLTTTDISNTTQLIGSATYIASA
jgi:hypothetical protein